MKPTSTLPRHSERSEESRFSLAKQHKGWILRYAQNDGYGRFLHLK
jgi:hypothetical protein